MGIDARINVTNSFSVGGNSITSARYRGVIIDEYNDPKQTKNRTVTTNTSRLDFMADQRAGKSK